MTFGITLAKEDVMSEVILFPFIPVHILNPHWLDRSLINLKRNNFITVKELFLRQIQILRAKQLFLKHHAQPIFY